MRQVGFILNALFSLYPATHGRIGSILCRIRASILRIESKKIGARVVVGRFNHFVRVDQIEIAENSGIGNYCFVCGPVKIGRDCMIADQTMILTQNHAYNDLKSKIKEQGLREPKKVIVEDDVWIGARVIILPGVKIGRGSVIGAGAVLRQDIPENSVVIGNPAQIVKKRGEKSAEGRTKKALGKRGD